MARRIIIALDAMGGDRAPDIVMRGAALALERYPDIGFLIFGDEAKVRPFLDASPALRAASEFRHTPDAVASDIKPSAALRQARNSSMRLAINAVKQGEAVSIVSAGNTGALMAIAKFVLGTMPGIDRPAIATLLPTRRGECCVLDLGANLESDAENLVQFALMGALFCRTLMGKAEPSIGLLNIGVEEMKGHEEVRMAAAILRERPLPGRFIGFVEGDDITAGTADVIVTDGFSGNIALKATEGAAKLMAYFLEKAFRSSWLAGLGYLLARPALNVMRLRADPRRYNGAMFLGLCGVCVKSHGGTDHEGFANAIGVAFDLADRHYNDQIRDELQRHYGTLEDSAPAPEGDVTP